MFGANIRDPNQIIGTRDLPPPGVLWPVDKVRRAWISSPTRNREQRMTLISEIQRIRSYTRENEELLRAHHFLFDLPVNKSSLSARFVVIGINPGEQRGDWEAYPQPTEETREKDFRDETGFRPRGASRWIANIEFFCGTRDVVMSEFFLWSSKDVSGSFVERFECSLSKSKHLHFCADRNNALVDHYSPHAVIAPGLGYSSLFAGVYGLTYVNTLRDGSSRLVEHFERGGTPWLFTKHWSGARGFSNAQRQSIRSYIANAATKGRANPA